MTSAVAVCLAVSVVAVCVVVLAKLIKGSPPQRNKHASHGMIEGIRDIGELVALTVHAKEIVTVNEQDGRLTKGGKMAMICSFDIEYRYNLKACEFHSTETGCRIFMPMQRTKISTEKLQIYDESKGRILGFPIEMSVGVKNDLIRLAREEACKMAGDLNNGWQERAELSVRETLQAVAKGLGCHQISIEFKKSADSGGNLIKAVKDIAA